MKRLQLSNIGKNYSLEMVEESIPKPQSGEILVKVIAAGLNRADVLLAIDHYPVFSPPPYYPGLEFSGIVEESLHPDFKPGDEVMGLVKEGAFADYLIVDGGICFHNPAHLSLEQAAALPEAMFTIWHNLFVRAGIQPYEKLLVTAASSGIGSHAVMIARLFDIDVAVITANHENHSKLQELGARIVNYDMDEKFDVILDLYGGNDTAKHIEMVNPHGRIALIGLTHGMKAELSLHKILAKNITLFSTTLKTMKLEEKQNIASSIKKNLLDLDLKPIIYTIYSMDEARDAFALMLENKHFGKIILKCE